MAIPASFLDFRNSLPDSVRKLLPLRPRLLESTTEELAQETDSFWLVIVPDDGPAELVQYHTVEALALRVAQLFDRSFFGHVFMFEGRRILLSNPPQPQLVLSDGRLLPVQPPPDMLQIRPDGLVDPDGWVDRMQAALQQSRKPRRRAQTSAGDYTDEDYSDAGVDTSHDPDAFPDDDDELDDTSSDDLP